MPSSEIMSRWKSGTLHSGRGKNGRKGKIVRNQKQAVAIKLNYERKEGRGKKRRSRR